MFTGNTEIYYENGERALLIIGLSNIYVWGLQYLYLPSQEGLKEIRCLSELRKLELDDSYCDERDMGVVRFSGHKYMETGKEQDATADDDDSLNPGQL